MIPLRMMLLMSGAASLFFMAGGILMLRAVSCQRRVDARIASVRAGRVQGRKQQLAGARHVLQFVSGVGVGILRSGMLSSQAIRELTRKLATAGIRNSNAVGIFIGVKILLLIALPTFTFIVLHGLISLTFLRNTFVVGATIGGLLLPDMCLGFLRKRYQTALDRGLPDALDMMVMCAESGLSLEPTIARVGTEIQPAHPEISGELLLTSQEFQMSSDSHVVLSNLGERRVCSTLSQTLQYGTPLSDALRVLSAEMRQEALTRFEEKAARLPVLLTVPMILFILPSLFLIVGGPAVMQVLNLMKN